MGIYQYPRTYTHGIQTFSYAKSGNVQLTAHFSLKEFRSKDGADEIVICPDLLNCCLEPLFSKMNAKAINITSGYRSIAHSKAVGGAGARDNHHMGMAVDVKVKKQDGTYYSAKEVAVALQDMGWEHGIGLMSTAVHIDTGSKYWFDETKKSGGAYVQVADWHSYTGIGISSVTKPSTPTHNGTAYVLTCSKLTVRKSASTFSAKAGEYYKGQTFYVVRWSGNWAQLESGNWMCAKKYCIKK